MKKNCTMARHMAVYCIVCLLALTCFLPHSSAQILHLRDIGADYRWLYYTGDGGAQLSLFTFEPDNHKAGDRCPAIVFIHGGGFIGGDPSYFFPHCRYFAERGAVAFSIGYRLISKKGLDGIDAIGVCISDCKSAIRYIRTNAESFGIDPDRITVIGDSAGGHLAACMGMFPDAVDSATVRAVSSRANAMVLYNPPVDLEIKAFNNVFAIREFGDAEKERLKHFSPITYVTDNLPPTLIMHGTEDVTIPIEQVYRFTGKMKKAGNRCDMIALEGTKHAFVIVGIGTDKTIVRALQETDRFLASLGYLKGEPTIHYSLSNRSE